MSDFISRSEQSVCLRRRIEDRVQVTRDLAAIIKRHGSISAADQLGLPVGTAERIVERKAAIVPDLLTAMYGAGGHKLLPGLATVSAIDADVAKIAAALAGARPQVAAVAERVVEADHEWSLTGDEVAVLRATLGRAREVCGGWRLAALQLGLGQSTVGNLFGGHKAWTAKTADLVRTWGDANPAGPSAAPGISDGVAAVANGIEDVTDLVPPGSIDREAAGTMTPPPAPDTAVLSHEDAAAGAVAGEEAAVATAVPALLPAEALPVSVAAPLAVPAPMGAAELPGAVAEGEVGPACEAALPPSIVAAVPDWRAPLRAVAQARLAEITAERERRLAEARAFDDEIDRFGDYFAALDELAA